MTRDEFVEELKGAKDGIKFQFMKVNGDIRDMLGSLHTDNLPPKNPNELNVVDQTKSREQDPKYVVFWDMEDSRFKSLVWDRFIKLL